MTGKKRIIAIGTGGDHTSAAGHEPFDLDAREAPVAKPDPRTPDEPGETQAAAPIRLGGGWLAMTLAGLCGIGWSGFFLWAERARLSGGVTPAEGAALFASWTPPMGLIAVCWLLALRTSRRESARFGQVARLLSVESARLEHRLAAVNGELSLAREFIAAQARDLESLGRIAVERLSEHADRLQHLIRDNSAQVEAIGGVSSTALDNMERLRGQLPVIASSTKDVANTFGLASHAAQTALADLVAGLDRVGIASADSGQRIGAVQDRVVGSLDQFDARLELIESLVATRLDALEQRGEQLRAQLTADETDALAALERRAAALSDAVTQTRTQLDADEGEALTSLRARLSALRDEGAAVSRALRAGETGAIETLSAAKERIEAEIAEVVDRLDQLDRAFADELEQRLDAARSRDERERDRIAELFRQLDEEIEARQFDQRERQDVLARQSQAIATRFDGLSERIAAIAAFGNQAEESLGKGLAVLADRLGSSREALAGTDDAIAHLTDGAVRLLELIQAGAGHARDEFPKALAQGEAGLVQWEARVRELSGTVRAASGQGQALADTIAATRSGLAAAGEELGLLHDRLADRTGAEANRLAALRDTLAELGKTSEALAEQASTRLATAITDLTCAARAVTATLGTDSAQAVSAIAARLGEESAAAIERALRERLAEAVGSLDQAAGQAAGVSREAAILLRDQLARVSELTSNLENRVAQARQRAEEQVDNQFSRRVALITEALNSNAIDVAKALSTEVADTAWAAYLRGDRGVFTRRALRLLDASEQRDIMRMYATDHEFRGNVSRYIHDFEAMLRQLLSTRDGHALGVTLLSSDMGKLYVLLAQAIERLRT